MYGIDSHYLQHFQAMLNVRGVYQLAHSFFQIKNVGHGVITCPKDKCHLENIKESAEENNLKSLHVSKMLIGHLIIKQYKGTVEGVLPTSFFKDYFSSSCFYFVFLRKTFKHFHFIYQVKHKLAEGVESANKKLCKVESLKNGGKKLF